MTFTSRSYSDATDLTAMLDLLVAVRSAEHVSDYPGVVDLREMLSLTPVQDNTRLWFDAGDHLIGFAFVDPYHNLRFEFDHSAANLALEQAIVAWGETCLRHTLQTSNESWQLDASCRADNAERIALLERHGFVRQELSSLQFIRPLDEPIPPLNLPPGFTLRCAAGEHEAEALVALHRAAFGTDHMTIAERQAMMRVPEYDAELDLLVVGPDGRLAAYCFCSISQEENERTGRNEGYTDPIATHPDYQRRGLAKALLLTGLHKLKQRGIAAAALGTSSKNKAMQNLAQAVGFRVRSTTLWFSKPVSPHPKRVEVPNTSDSSHTILSRHSTKVGKL